jgi:hypothetical protein
MGELLGAIAALLGEVILPGLVQAGAAPGMVWFRIVLNQKNPKPLQEWAVSIAFYIAVVILACFYPMTFF